MKCTVIYRFDRPSIVFEVSSVRLLLAGAKLKQVVRFGLSPRPGRSVGHRVRGGAPADDIGERRRDSCWGVAMLGECW